MRTNDRFEWVVRLVVVFAVAMLVVGALFYGLIRDLTAGWTGTGLNPFRPAARATEVPVAPIEPTPRCSCRITPYPGMAARVTILLLGLDCDWEAWAGRCAAIP
jgi:hypothetical protein